MKLLIDFSILFFVILCTLLVFLLKLEFPIFIKDSKEHPVTKEEILIDLQFLNQNFPSKIYNNMF